MVFIFFYLKNLNGMRSRSAGGRGTTLGTIMPFLPQIPDPFVTLLPFYN